MRNKHVNYCLDCKTKNCYHRNLKPKKSNCLEIEYKDEVKITPSQAALISKTNVATKIAFGQRTFDHLGVNWITSFIKNFFGDKITVGIASCLGSIETARGIIAILEAKEMKTALVTCKMGGLTIDGIGDDGKPYKHPGCNPIAQAKILNKLDVPVVVLVSLCIGHDMIFIKYCKSYVIPFITKMPMGYGLV